MDAPDLNSSDFPFPTVEQHTTILGRNGSGKTQFGAWLLSHSAFEDMPFVIVDHKRDALINSIGAEEWSIYNDPPDKPGIFIVHPKPGEEEQLESFLWKIFEHGNCGLYFDEGFMVAQLKSLDAILMQGRSKHIPCIILSQRPSWISRYAFSEASIFVLFHLHDRRDRVKVREFFDAYTEERLPKYHAQLYDVNNDKNFTLHPVSDSDTIRARFENRLSELRQQSRPKKRFI